MTQIAVIAVNTFREAIRNRVLYILLLFAILLVLSAGVLSDLSISEPRDIILSIGLSAINFFSLMIAIFIGIGLVYNEIDKRTIYTIVSKPIDRTHFILGKYFGLLLTIYVNVLIMTLFFFFTIHFQHAIEAENISAHLQRWVVEHDRQTYQPSVLTWYYISSFFGAIGKAFASLVAYDPSGLTKGLLTAIGMNCFELAIITAFAILFSSFSTPTLSAFLTVMTFLVGRGNEDIINFVWTLENKMAKMAEAGIDVDFATQLKYHLTNLVAHVAPNLSIFNLRSDVVYGTVDLYLWQFLYGFTYPVAVLALAILVFRRRNFK